MENGIVWALLIGGSIVGLLLGVPPAAVIIVALIWLGIAVLASESEKHDEEKRDLMRQLDEERRKQND